MTTISHNLTGKIDERTVALLSEIDTIAGDLRLPFFIVGATARDILLQHAHDIHPVRATLDIDIGVFVSDWDQFLALKEAFEHTGEFSSTKQAQRLIYTDDLPSFMRRYHQSQAGCAAHSIPTGKTGSIWPAKARPSPRR